MLLSKKDIDSSSDLFDSAKVSVYIIQGVKNVFTTLN